MASLVVPCRQFLRRLVYISRTSAFASLDDWLFASLRLWCSHSYWPLPRRLSEASRPRYDRSHTQAHCSPRVGSTPERLCLIGYDDFADLYMERNKQWQLLVYTSTPIPGVYSYQWFAAAAAAAAAVLCFLLEHKKINKSKSWLTG